MGTHRQLAIGCSEHLCVWETRTGDLLQKYTISDQANINCLSYSPDGAHLAVGLDSGQVQVFQIACSCSIFFLRATSVRVGVPLFHVENALIASYVCVRSVLHQ